MSFILDALRRAERERNLGQAPRMEDVALASTPAPATTGSRRGLNLLLIALLVIIAVLLAALLMRHSPASAPAGPAATTATAEPGVVNATVRGPTRVAPAPSASPPAAAPAPSASPPAAAPETDSTAEDDAPPAVAEDAALSSLDDLTGAPSRPAPTTPPSAAASRPDFVAHTDAEIAATEAAERAAAEASDAAVLAAPRLPRGDSLQLDPAPNAPTAGPAGVADSSATPISQMPPAYRADFPAMSVQVHVWDANPARRFVLLDGHKYLEGDTLSSGPRLVQIAQNGMVFEFHGARVLLPPQ